MGAVCGKGRGRCQGRQWLRVQGVRLSNDRSCLRVPRHRDGGRSLGGRLGAAEQGDASTRRRGGRRAALQAWRKPLRSSLIRDLRGSRRCCRHGNEVCVRFARVRPIPCFPRAAMRLAGTLTRAFTSGWMGVGLSALADCGLCRRLVGAFGLPLNRRRGKCFERTIDRLPCPHASSGRPGDLIGGALGRPRIFAIGRIPVDLQSVRCGQQTGGGKEAGPQQVGEGSYSRRSCSPAAAVAAGALCCCNPCVPVWNRRKIRHDSFAPLFLALPVSNSQAITTKGALEGGKEGKIGPCGPIGSVGALLALFGGWKFLPPSRHLLPRIFAINESNP